MHSPLCDIHHTSVQCFTYTINTAMCNCAVTLTKSPSIMYSVKKLYEAKLSVLNSDIHSVTVPGF